jgi:hypothetical protein
VSESSYFLRSTHNLKKNPPHGFDGFNQLICQNHEDIFFEFCVFLKKSELYQKAAAILHQAAA